jgi:hypothetical protein
VIATGKSASETLSEFSRAAGIAPAQAIAVEPQAAQALVWFVRRDGEEPELIQTRRARGERRRHKRNYAQGELSPEQSFYFRGPEGKLNLRAQNLMTFLQMGEGVDEETWLYHARNGDYSRWFATMIKDDELAATAREIEQNGSPGVAEGRKKLRAAVESRYTAAA